jgi:diazepam-binding inhibitor (GABA receptor modulator, acyl-CoA-binding protein)
MTDSTLEQRFLEMAERVRTGQVSIMNPSNDQKLQMYALYKQAIEGDVQGDKPGMLDFVGRAKHKAWSELEGMTREDAMRAYIALFE